MSETDAVAGTEAGGGGSSVLVPDSVAPVGRPYTRQEAFDRVWQWFIVEQHPRAVDPQAAWCCYRTPDRCTACAIGCLIPDSRYRTAFDGPYGGTFRDLQKLGDWDAVAQLFSPDDDVFYQDLQQLHDYIPYGSGRLEGELRRFADRHGLTIPEGAPTPEPSR